MHLLIAEIKVASVRELAKLGDSELLRKVMSHIDKYSKVPRKSVDIIGPVESDPEYQLIVEANNMAVDIDDEIGIRNIMNFKHSYNPFIFTRNRSYIFSHHTQIHKRQILQTVPRIGVFSRRPFRVRDDR